MILLVVMAVLSFFAVMGMTFILMTGKNRDSAETAQLAAQNSKTAGNSPQELLEEGIMQVLVGPANGNGASALNDHRIVMAMSVILSWIGGMIDDAQAVRKSYPGFFADIKRLGAKVEVK